MNARTGLPSTAPGQQAAGEVDDQRRPREAPACAGHAVGEQAAGQRPERAGGDRAVRTGRHAAATGSARAGDGVCIAGAQANRAIG
jgi:hypothetical protein